MKNYEKIINKNNVIQNSVALTMLLQYGRNTILDDKSFEEISKEFANTVNSLMTEEFQKEILSTSRELAKMKEKDVYDFIYDKVKEERRQERGVR